MKRTLAVVGVLAATVALSSCSQVSTAPDEVALHYSGGAFTSKNFKECVAASNRQFDGPGDKHYTYPASQRNVVFDQDGDIPPITFVTKDGIEMTATGVLNFLLNTSCKPFKANGKTYKGGALQQFHELIGNRYAAYNDNGETSKGWDTVLRIYLGRPLDTAIDRAGQDFSYSDLYSNPATKAAWEKAVLKQLPGLVDRQTDGDTSFFENFAVTLQKPEPPAAIKAALVERQEAIAKADTAKAQADAQAAAARAQVATARAEASKQKQVINGYGGFDNFKCVYMADKGLNCDQPTYIVSGTKP